MSYCRLIPTPDGRWRCDTCARIYAMLCLAKCRGKQARTPNARAEDKAARCRACPHVRRETPMAISCQVLDGEITCPRERIGRHQRRLLDPSWSCTIAR